MCAYSHILFRPNFRPNTPNTNLKCQENVCFCICVCAGTDMRKMNKNKAKPIKTSTRMEKGQKPSRGSKMIKESSNYHQKSSGIHKVACLVLGQSFEKLAVLVPHLSDIGNYGPWNNI